MSTAVQSFLTHCAIERGLSPNTVAAYRLDLTALLASLGERAPEDATTEDLATHMRFLGSEGKSAATCNRHRMTLRSFYRFLGKTVADNLEAAKEGSALPDVLPRESLDRMIDGAEGYERLVLELLYCCGLRASELQDVQIAGRGKSLLVRGKGNKERLVPCPPTVLSRMLTFQHTVRALTRFQVYGIVQRAAERVGTTAHPHQLRHSFATHLLAGGANIRIVQELLGHACVETTERYTRVDSSRLKEVIREFHPRP